MAILRSEVLRDARDARHRILVSEFRKDPIGVKEVDHRAPISLSALLRLRPDQIRVNGLSRPSPVLSSLISHDPIRPPRNVTTTLEMLAVVVNVTVKVPRDP